MELPYSTAAIIGLIGSTHCLGMCGGIIGALGNGLQTHKKQNTISMLLCHLTYNAGRIVSYMIAGAIVGTIANQVGQLHLTKALPAGGFIAALFLIALGLYIGGWWRAIDKLEWIGQYLWRQIEPFGKRFFPVRSFPQAFGLGLVWGWLPCGLVYSALALAMLSGSPGHGSLLMLSFGLGTLPMLLLMGKTIEYLGDIIRHKRIRQLAGVLVILFGAFTGLATQNHHHTLPGTSNLDSSTHLYLQTAVSFLFGEELCWTPRLGRD